MPELRHRDQKTELLVRGQPFLILGGELGNSTASDSALLRPLWPRLLAMHLNTVLLPVYWELLEPQEGRFAFGLLDQALEDARRHGLRLVLLWFGSWKNSMSCYAPAWVKTDTRRFPRARIGSGRALEILSAFSPENRDADARAFAALLAHIKAVDSASETVIMVQVENEVGMLEEARDHSELANHAFTGPVPAELLRYLDEREGALEPGLREAWQRAGRKTSGNYTEVFGQGLGTDEIFMAWHYACYTNHVARAGKARYALPMFVNAALNRPGHLPGRYPSAGPLPHLFDLWRAGAPAIDCLAPDIYLDDFADWCEKYHRPPNPLFVPEAQRGEASAVHAFYAVGQHAALGFSPFAIELAEPPVSDWVAQSYQVLAELTPLLIGDSASHQTGGFLVDGEGPTSELVLGDFLLRAAHDFTWEWSPGYRSAGPWPRFGGLAVALGAGEFLLAGRGLIVTFEPKAPGDAVAGILGIEEGRFDPEGRWVPGRRLNGDESHQGRHLRLPPERISVQKVWLYRYA